MEKHLTQLSSSKQEAIGLSVALSSSLPTVEFAPLQIRIDSPNVSWKYLEKIKKGNLK